MCGDCRFKWPAAASRVGSVLCERCESWVLLSPGKSPVLLEPCFACLLVQVQHSKKCSYCYCFYCDQQGSPLRTLFYYFYLILTIFIEAYVILSCFKGKHWHPGRARGLLRVTQPLCCGTEAKPVGPLHRPSSPRKWSQRGEGSALWWTEEFGERGPGPPSHSVGSLWSLKCSDAAQLCVHPPLVAPVGPSWPLSLYLSFVIFSEPAWIIGPWSSRVPKGNPNHSAQGVVWLLGNLLILEWFQTRIHKMITSIHGLHRCTPTCVLRHSTHVYTQLMWCTHIQFTHGIYTCAFTYTELTHTHTGAHV